MLILNHKFQYICWCRKNIDSIAIRIDKLNFKALPVIFKYNRALSTFGETLKFGFEFNNV